MKLIPHVGSDRVVLGMNRDEVRKSIGPPDTVEPLDVPPETGGSDTWIYEDLGIALCFDEDVELRLARLTVVNPDAELLGFRPIGCRDYHLRTMYPNAKLVFSVEDDHEFEDSTLDIAFWVEDGRVVSITLSPEYDATGNVPAWPDGR